MKDNLSIIITMIVFVVLMVIFPLYNYFERQDDMSYNLALKATTNFVDSVVSSGYFDQELYDKFISELANTGMFFDIEIEVQKKTYTKDPYEIQKGELEYSQIPFIEQFYSYYNNDIFDENTGAVESVDPGERTLKNGCYYLNEGDKIFLKLKNSSTTMAGAIFSIIVPTSSTERIKINYGGIVKNNAWEETPQSQIVQGDIYVRIDPKTNTIVNTGNEVWFTTTITNFDESVNDANKIKEILKNNLKLSLVSSTQTSILYPSNVDIFEANDSSTTINVSFTIPEAQIEGQYEVILPSSIIQGRVGKNLETKSRIIYINKEEET